MEIAPGVWHWTAYHEGIRQQVHSHFLEAPRVLLDPMLPEEGFDPFEGDRRPERILLTNRHHLRHSERFVDAFGCRVLCSEQASTSSRAARTSRPSPSARRSRPGSPRFEVETICLTRAPSTS